MTALRRRRGAGLGASLAAVALSALVTGCSAGPSTSLSTTPGADSTTSLAPPADGSPQPSPSSAASQAPAAELQSPVTGVVLHVDVAGLGHVTGFRLLVPGGQQVDFTMGVQDNAATFPAAHLSEHMASGDPVRVSFRREGSTLVVYHLEDAAGASPSAPALPSVSPVPADHSDAPAAS